ncbi:MAG: endonuclease/exonuclease/phosphatase family protein [Lentisphaeria bacterium]|nr:endonuclease/exonuclease/phosphatase family protein [Lentisphaeria bacterium]
MASYRIMTYNIRHGEGLDGQLDPDRIAAVIRREQADLVALMDVDGGTDGVGGGDELAELAAATGLDGIFCQSIAYRNGSYGNAILSRFPVRAQARYALPGRERRSVLAADLELPVGGSLRFATTHLDLDEESRLESAPVLQAFLDGLPRLPTILGGDFNDPPGSAVVHAFARAGWHLASGDRFSPTYPAQAPETRIDYLLSRDLPANMSLEQAQVVAEPLASDHCPLLAVLTVRTEV